VPVSIIDEKHQGNGAAVAPHLTVVDIRAGSSTAHQALEQARAMWPATIIFAVASASGPEQILEAMRGGANEFLVWSTAPDAQAFDDAFRSALHRTSEKTRTARDGARSGLTFTFFGAKGGAGTTTLAVNSAIEIARVTKRPTLIIDLHEFLGEVSLFLGVRPRFTLIDALDNLHRLDQDFLKELVVRHKSGLDILAGGDQVDRPNAQDVSGIEHLLQLLSRTYDYIVIDAGLVTGPLAEVAVCIADTIYLVGNPDVASIRNTHRVVDRIAQLGADKDRVRILLNRTSEHHQIAPKQIETALGRPIYMSFPSDYGAVSAALNSGVPLTQSNHSEIASQVTRLTKEILQMPTEAEPVAVRSKGPFLGLF
jgi:pilus assembly protein CpaE